jgi:hypothetical protein
LIFGLNNNAIGSGVIANILFTIPAGAPAGTVPIAIGGIVAADPNALAVALAGTSGSVQVLASPDTTPPTIGITLPTSGPTYTTSSSPLSIGGTASDNVGVTQVIWVNSAGGSGTAAGTTSWSVTGIALVSGSNILTVKAWDAAGNSGTATLTVTYNPTGPVQSTNGGAGGTSNTGALVAGGSSVSMNITAGGSAASSTPGLNETTQTGYARDAINAGAAPYGTAVISLKQNGVTVGETGVPASPPTTAARIFIDYRSAAAAIPASISAGTIDIDTGIAAVNYGSASANVTYTLRNMAGGTLSTGHGTLAAGAHFATFIDQLNAVAPDFVLPVNFQTAIQFASLDISSDQPLSILALRMTTNQTSEALFTTAPMADLTKPATSGAIFFPQFADGGGYTSSLILLNTSSTFETGELQLMDDHGNPMVVSQAGGTPGFTFPYSIPSGGVVRFQTDGSAAGINVGWVQLTPDPGSPTPIGSGVFSYTPADVMVSESGIPSAVPTTHARIYVDLSGGHDTGLAIANIGGTAANITINAFNNDGVTPAGTSQGPLPLTAYGHDADFAEHFITGLPAGFTGVLDIRSVTPFAALTVRSLTNELGFLFTTFPIADMTAAAPSPIVFPQIADGGGNVTQFILISAGGASSTTLSFYGEDGKPLAIGQ